MYTLFKCLYFYIAGILLGLVIGAIHCKAADYTNYRLLDVDRIDMDYSKIKNNRDSYYGYPDPATNADEVWDYSVALDFNLALAQVGPLKLLYNNRVNCDATNKQVRTVGWKYRVGFSLYDKISLTEDHYSRHVLDTERTDKFPLENRYTLEVVFYDRQTTNK